MSSSPAAIHSDPAESTPPEGAFAAFEDGYFQRHLGLALDRLLAPLDGLLPAGPPVRGTMMFRRVEQARRSDDPNLPQGAWVAELRRADWPRVASLCAQILAETAKDLQLASWLLEAEIHQRGIAAIAPGIALMHGLCERWWSGLHPQGEDGDLEPRANVVRWVGEKLLPAVSLAPLAAHGERVASWTDWELAHRHERIRAAKGEIPEEASDAPSLDDLHALLAAVPVDALRARYGELALAREAIAAFEASLRQRFESEPPTLGRLDALLARAQGPLHGELARRGVPLSDEVAAAPADEAADFAGSDAGEPAPDELTVSDRDRAYRMLGEIADFLARIEPHSPVPYLLRRAVVWGGLNTAELYHELFVKGNAHLSLFDLLGVAVEDDSATSTD